MANKDNKERLTSLDYRENRILTNSHNDNNPEI